MADRDIITDFNHSDVVIGYITEQLTSLEEYISSYQDILNEVCDKGYIDGQTAESLRLFAEQVSFKTKEAKQSTTQQINQLTLYNENYQERIDYYDKGLYN